VQSFWKKIIRCNSLGGNRGGVLAFEGRVGNKYLGGGNECFLECSGEKGGQMLLGGGGNVLNLRTQKGNDNLAKTKEEYRVCHKKGVRNKTKYCKKKFCQRGGIF